MVAVAWEDILEKHDFFFFFFFFLICFWEVDLVKQKKMVGVNSYPRCVMRDNVATVGMGTVVKRCAWNLMGDSLVGQA